METAGSIGSLNLRLRLGLAVSSVLGPPEVGALASGVMSTEGPNRVDSDAQLELGFEPGLGLVDLRLLPWLTEV